MTHRLQRILFLALFLPQLLTLGMGSSLVVCVSDGGHMQVELVASSCCNAPPQGDAAGGQDGKTNGSEDCGSCSDVAVLVNLTVSERHGKFQVDPGPILPLDLWQTASAFEPRPESGELLRALDGASTHLTHLRCVVLRC